ncbi:MAG: APC family permease, partial [Clostridia bacterium]|nr:APC family permease [Clostridia bacterium]
YFPGLTSVLSWVTARYTLEFIVSANPDFPLIIPAAQGGCVIGPECVALTLLIMCFTYAVNSLSPKIAGRFQTSTTVIKMIPLCMMIVAGIVYGLANGTLQSNFVTTVPAVEVTGNPLFGAVCATAFAYEGWIIATSINAEIKDSKKNLPKALIIGGIIIIAVYLFYYIGVAGGATNQELIEKGATVAFTNIFGGFLGNILNLFIAVSCLGTTNGLMMACCRSIYSLAARGEGPKPAVYSQLDGKTNMPNNSAIFGLMIAAAWFVYFYLSNLAATWSGPFVFDISELPIITIYMMYIPIFIQWMRKEKSENVIKRYVLPVLAVIGSLFMMLACVLSHKMGVLWYMIVFVIIMAAGGYINSKNKK